MSTEVQDCNIIADAFERGAFFSNTEASVFAPLTRNVQNMRSFARLGQFSLKSYDITSKLPFKDKKEDKPDDAAKQGIRFKNVYVAFPTGAAGAAMERAIKDCIPCFDRQARMFGAFAVSISNINFFKMLKDVAKQQLEALTRISDLLSNIDIYGDFCQMVSFLDFMCVPDLQRILAVLASLSYDIGIQLSTLNSLLLKLTIPFFMPVLLSILALLDQFAQLVLNFMNCIITSIDENLRKININSIFLTGTPITTSSSNAEGLQKNIGQFRSGLMMLGTQLVRGEQVIAGKITFYTDQARKMMASWGIQDKSALAAAEQKLITIRLIALVSSMIKVKSKGKQLCENYSKPAPSELDNFYNNFVSPTSSFNFSVDAGGNLHVSEKTKISVTGVVSISGTKLLNTPSNLFNPVDKKFTCLQKTKKEDLDRVNTWISQLDSAS